MNKCIFILFLSFPFLGNSQNVDEKVKILANEIADQVVKTNNKKVAVIAFEYKECLTEFGKTLAEDLTGYLSVSGRNITVVNQKLLEKLLEQNKLTAKGLLEAKNDAAKLGQTSGINSLVYGTITTVGEEVRISVSIVKLPTLEVYGFSKSAFPLTNGITAMLQCLSKTSAESVATPSIEHCEGNIGGICVTNNSTVDVTVDTYTGDGRVLVHPGDTECMEKIKVERDYEAVYVYVQKKGFAISSQTINVEKCKNSKLIIK